MCLSGENDIYEMYREFQWHFQKMKIVAGENWSDIYRIDPFYSQCSGRSCVSLPMLLFYYFSLGVH